MSMVALEVSRVLQAMGGIPCYIEYMAVKLSVNCGEAFSIYSSAPTQSSSFLLMLCLANIVKCVPQPFSQRSFLVVGR